MHAQPEPTDRAEVNKLAQAVEEALAGEMRASSRSDNIRRLFAALDELAAEQPTTVRIEDPAIPSFEDGPRIGNTPPVAQPDSRIAPQWAVGLAVASIGVGAGSTGLGCAAWLFFRGLSLVSVPGLERFAWIIIAPFAGAAMVVTAIGGAISKARSVVTTVHNHNSGPIRQDNRVSNTKSIWHKTINE